MALTLKKRFEIFKRDGFTCQYCGNTPPNVVLEIDHIVPIFENGTDDNINLITSCFDCTRGKGKDSLNEIPETLEEKIKIQKEKKKQLEQFNNYLMKIRKNEDEEIEYIGVYWFNMFFKVKNKSVFGPGRIPTIRTFLKHLPKAEILEAVEIAFARIPVVQTTRNKYYNADCKTWKYFCGVCWRKIKKDRYPDEN